MQRFFIINIRENNDAGKKVFSTTFKNTRWILCDRKYAFYKAMILLTRRETFHDFLVRRDYIKDYSKENLIHDEAASEEQTSSWWVKRSKNCRQVRLDNGLCRAFGPWSHFGKFLKTRFASRAICSKNKKKKNKWTSTFSHDVKL